MNQKKNEERPHDQWTLPNGLRVIGERLPYLRSVSIGVWLRVGSMMELPNENGLSHYLEHMVFKGTTHRNARQIAEAMDAVGGQLNAFTGKDCTCIYAKVIDEDIGLAIDVLSDLSIHATLDETEFNKERGVILEEIAMDEDSPEDLVHDLLCAAQYGDQPLGMPILGTSELVGAYTRQDLFNYRAKHYRPSDTVVSIAGNYDPEEVGSLLDKYFGCWEDTGRSGEYEKMTALTGRSLVKTKDIEQLHLCIGYPSMAYGDERKYAQAVMNNILGGSMSSRLFQRIREELGMAYSIYTCANGYVGCGSFGIYAGVSPKNGKTVMDEIQKELDRFLKDGMTEEEFRSAKTQLRSGYLMSLESPGSRMQNMGRAMLLRGTTRGTAETIALIDSVTMEDTMNIARSVLTAAPCVAAVGKNAGEFAF